MARPPPGTSIMALSSSFGPSKSDGFVARDLVPDEGADGFEISSDCDRELRGGGADERLLDFGSDVFVESERMCRDDDEGGGGAGILWMMGRDVVPG